MLLRTWDVGEPAALVSRGVTWSLMPAFCGVFSGLLGRLSLPPAGLRPNA
jgi:hypothetical protein